MKIFTETEIKLHLSNGDFTLSQATSHRLALSQEVAKQDKIKLLNTIRTTNNLYQPSFNEIVTALTIQPNDDAKYQFNHAEAIIEYVLTLESRLSPSECLDIVDMYKSDELKATSLSYMSQQIAKMFYPDRYQGDIPTDRFTWVEDFTIAYCKYYHPSVEITLDGVYR